MLIVNYSHVHEPVSRPVKSHDVTHVHRFQCKDFVIQLYGLLFLYPSLQKKDNS